MFARNGFANKTPAGYASDAGTGLLPVIHEEETQLIQGGEENQHYHLTEAEHEFILQLLANGVSQKVYEPMRASGDWVFTNAGDCMMAWGGGYAA